MTPSSNSIINKACWIFVCSIMLILTVATLIKHGMFMDAMLYTSVSHNLSHGIGTFWLPYFDEYNVADLTSFHEQPPLAFGIQSLFFRLLGDSMYVERFYTFFTMCVNAFLINILWKEITKDMPNLKTFGWLAILLWITIPVCFWSYSNNMHENTMSMFTLGSVIFSYKAMQSQQNKIIYFIMSACFICLAALTKGFPGLFPITVPFLHWLFIRKKTFPKIVLYSGVMLLVMIIVGFALYLYPPSHESLSIYLFKRAFQRINEAPSVDSRFFILWRLLSELIPAFAFTALFVLISAWKKFDPEFSTQKKQAFLFIFIGLSGSIPLMLTMVQNGFYFVASLPFFGIGFALISAPVIRVLLQKIKPELSSKLYIGSIAFLFAGIVFIYFQKDKYSRDKELLHDVEQIASVVPANTRINCSNSTYSNWSLNCYLVRTYGISINNIAFDSTPRKYFVTEVNNENPDSTKFNEIPLSTTQYKLYQMIR